MTARSHSRSYSRLKQRIAKARRDQGVPRRDLRDAPERRTPKIVRGETRPSDDDCPPHGIERPEHVA